MGGLKARGFGFRLFVSGFFEDFSARMGERPFVFFRKARLGDGLFRDQSGRRRGGGGFSARPCISPSRWSRRRRVSSRRCAVRSSL